MQSEKNGIRITSKNQHRIHKVLSSEDNAANRRRIKKLISSFAKSSNYDEALGKITTQKNVQRFVEYWSRQNLKWPETGEKLCSSSIRTYAIRARWRKAFQRLEHGLASPEACEESWWNCVWLLIEQLLDKMLQIKRKIESDVPLSKNEIAFLNHHIGHGAPRIEMLNCGLGQCSPKVILQQAVGQYSRSLQCKKMADVLLVQPAYVVAQQLEQRCVKPRFIKRCRAPSCGKLFYTGRRDATACPSKRSGAKSDCALAWIRYKRYLRKIGKEPEKDWDNKQLKKNFISYDKS